jgi:hypothetical protein
MKKSQLQQIIREEVSNELQEFFRKEDMKKFSALVSDIREKLKNSKLAADVDKFISMRTIDPMNTPKSILNQLLFKYKNDRNVEKLIQQHLQMM